EVDGAARGHCRLIVAVAGEGERAVGERKYEAAVTDGVAVEHVAAHRHRELGMTGADRGDSHPERLRGAVARVHALRDALGESLRLLLRQRWVMLAHGLLRPTVR